MFTIFVSSLVGSIVGILLVVTGQRAMQSRIPYGPYLALGAIIWVLWGEYMTRWYFELMTPDMSGL